MTGEMFEDTGTSCKVEVKVLLESSEPALTYGEVIVLKNSTTLDTSQLNPAALLRSAKTWPQNVQNIIAYSQGFEIASKTRQVRSPV